MYYYKVYGLKIKSRVELPVLLIDEEVEKVTDVEIDFTPMPIHIKSKIEEGVRSCYQSDEIWFTVNNLGIFRLLKGSVIEIELDSLQNIEWARQFIYYRCLAYILMQRDIVGLHGSAMVMNNQGVIISGDSGAGKSTLASALKLRGYHFMSDDVCGIYPQDNYNIAPGFPLQRLLPAVMVEQKYDLSKYRTIHEGRKLKYLVPVQHQFYNQYIKMNKLFTICVSDKENQVTIEKVDGINKLKEVYENIFGSSTKIEMGLAPSYFKQCLELSKQIEVYRITRPVDLYTVDEQINLIESVVFSKKEVGA